MNETENVFNNKSGLSTIKINYLMDYGLIYYPYLILNFFGIVMGTLGNVVVVGTILLDKALANNPAYILMVNLALSDIGISTFVHSFTNVGIYLGNGFFERRFGLCVFLGAWCLICCATSLVSMGFLAFNRYINICHNGLYQKMFSRKSALIYCLICWLAGILIDLPNFLGWGGHYFDVKSANCMWNRLANESYSIFFPTTAIFIPCVLIMIFYVRIFLFALRSKVKSRGKIEQKEIRQSLKVAKSLFASFLLFTLCWVPYGLVTAIDYPDIMPMVFHVLVTFMAHINSTMNPIFYIVFNPSFKSSFRRIYGKYIFNKSIVPSNTFTNNNNEKTTIKYT